MQCSNCHQEINDEEVYVYKGRKMCEECAMNMELYPRGHTGLYRDNICGDRKRLTIWWANRS
jgi:recombinational DNA repair protein (RecF pathway)